MNAPDTLTLDQPPPAFEAALKVLHRLAQRDDEDVPGRLLEITAETLGVARASLWALTPGRRSIRCRAMFEQGQGMLAPEIELACDAAPAYFHAIEGLLVLAAEDAQRDPRTVELAEGYLKPLGIGAILDVPICEFGEIVGVLCLEHLGPPRRWSGAERLFVTSLSGILSQRHDRLRMAATEDERKRQLLFDAATGLAGRSLFIDRLAHAVAELPAGHDLAVLALDLERLRSLAHRYGGNFADSVMAEGAARIGQMVPAARCGRIADDTFALWVSGDRAQGLATRLAGRLQRALALPMAAPDGDTLEFSTAVGIVPGARSEPDADRLLRDALTAAFSAARKGRGRVEVVWPDVRNELQSSLELEREVRRAADAREFTFRLQPIVDLVSGRALAATVAPDLPSLDGLLPVAAPSAPIMPVAQPIETPRSRTLDGLLGGGMESDGRQSFAEVRPSDFPFPDATLSGERVSSPMPRSPSGQRRPSGGAPRPDPRRAALPPEPPPPPPEGLDKTLKQKWLDVGARFVAIDTQNYFEMLGVGDTCSPDEVRDAYFASVKLWHPDRLPEGLEVLRPFVDRIFHHLTAARDLLSDEKQRQSYLKVVAQGGGKPSDDRKVEAILNATQEFEKAIVLTNRAKWDEALEVLAVCIELDPENPDYVALKAWAVLQKAPLESKLEAREALTIAEAALRLAKGSHHERAILTKGVALQRLGRAEDAYECFAKVVERNPKHLDASREVRLYDMRARKSMPPKAAKPDPSTPRPDSSNSLLSKLFGGKKP